MDANVKDALLQLLTDPGVVALKAELEAKALELAIELASTLVQSHLELLEGEPLADDGEQPDPELSAGEVLEEEPEPEPAPAPPPAPRPAARAAPAKKPTQKARQVPHGLPSAQERRARILANK